MKLNFIFPDFTVAARLFFPISNMLSILDNMCFFMHENHNIPHSAAIRGICGNTPQFNFRKLENYFASTIEFEFEFVWINANTVFTFLFSTFQSIECM